jgi:hypothetical protein
MGHVIRRERSPEPESTLIDDLTKNTDNNFSDTYFDPSEGSSDESFAGELTTMEISENLWDPTTLKNFQDTCSQIPPDAEFDKLTNRLLNALKDHVNNSKIYCPKCRDMAKVTKRGNAKRTYQFGCAGHTISATQILSTLPDSIVMQIIPKEPSRVFIETITWISKDHLSPELTDRKAKKNAVKRFSFQRSPPKGPTLRLSTHNLDILTELKEMRLQVANLKATIDILNERCINLEEVNHKSLKQVKALEEENQVLRKHLAAPSKLLSTINQDAPDGSSSYAKITTLHRPNITSRKHYTASYTPNPLPQEIIGPATAPQNDFSPLTFVYFKGCHKKNITDYRKLLDSQGFPKHLARDICFLAEDILQIITYQNKEELLIKTLTGVSKAVSHLPNFDPCTGVSYAEYGNFSDAQAKQSFFALMTKNTERITKEADRTPSLKRVSSFLKKVIESGNINYLPPQRTRRIFCLGDFITPSDNHQMDECPTPPQSPAPNNDACIPDSPTTDDQ